MSAFFLLAHRNQRSLTLDLKKPGGQAVARRLVERADVLVQNFRPGVMARFGLDWEAARALNPRLIYVSASGYGEKSPYRDRPGQDLLMQAFSGLAHISGRADQPPVPVGTAVVDQHGATLLALGVLGAIIERGRTGEGLHVEVSMLRAALDLQIEVASYHLNGAHLEKSATPLASTFHPAPLRRLCHAGRPHRALHVTARRARQRRSSSPPWPPMPGSRGTSRAREEIARLIEPAVRARTTAAWLERLVPLGSGRRPSSPTPRPSRIPPWRPRDAVEEIHHPVAGPVKLLRHPLEFSTGRVEVRRMPPMSGEHTDEILREAGYADTEIAALRQEGAVKPLTLPSPLRGEGWGEGLVGARQPEDVLREVVQRHLLRHRRDLVEPHLAPQPLHVELLARSRSRRTSAARRRTR